MSHSKILFQLSGSIACYKACHVVSRLVQAGHDVQIVATKSALEFVGPATLEGLTGKPVLSDVFASSRYMDHINLAKWADLVVLCPASANTINKLASGIGDDLVTTLFLAHDFKKPYVIAPAMNSKMYQHPVTSQSIKKLRSFGVDVLETGIGMLACGDIGEGKLLEPDEILSAIEKRLNKGTGRHVFKPKPFAKPLHALRVIITSGGTRETIDGVRSIANTSTGATGAVIADTLASHGHEVTFVHAKDSILPELKTQMKLIPYVSFSDLDKSLKNLLSGADFDAVVHAAAVSDFAVDTVKVDGQEISRERKIDSEAAVSIELKSNPKILPQLKKYSRNRNLVVIGFKLTNGASEQERAAAISKISKSADFIVHNDLSNITETTHEATIFENGRPMAHTSTKRELANVLDTFLTLKKDLAGVHV